VEISTDSGDTPDAIIEILEPVKVFVVIEAKMFSSIKQGELEKQIRAQKRAVIDRLAGKYSDSQMFHVALLPEKLKIEGNDDFQVIHWEFLQDEDILDLRENYFVNYLKYALENYARLVSTTSWREPSTATGKLKGLEIYDDHQSGKPRWVVQWRQGHYQRRYHQGDLAEFQILHQ